MDVDQDVAAGYLANFPLAIRPPVAGQNNNPFAPAAEAAEELINPDAAHDDGDIMPMLMPIVGDMVDGGMGGANHNPAINPIEHAFNMLVGGFTPHMSLVLTPLRQLDFFVFKPEADHPHPQPAPAAARCRHEKVLCRYSTSICLTYASRSSTSKCGSSPGRWSALP